MKKLVALAAVFAVVLSLTCVCMAKDNGPSCGAEYSNHKMKAWVVAPEERSNYYHYEAVELWNETGRFPNSDDINKGYYTMYTSRKQSASGYNKNANRGYAVMYLKDDYGDFVKEATRKGRYYN